jgi:hypothetical protein
MNPEDGNPANTSGDADMGAPIRVLIDQEVEPSPHFVAKVRRTIYRRTTASQFAAYSWHLPKMVLLEMVSLVGHLIKALGSSKES